ncbi:beta-glucoside-specific PTS transporter subunit IIABC [Cellulomonas sp. ACRRI]|uniref:beta-glucoside-specific PTS transporter subunit IIABC n=1 Tax=Cellulomonas sp. ACRRI TaxID=2918188 RepID=UPI001EF34F68|nr:beta-glucoside-specific PTS transporter subunit IIABC [Cellulomonas sp. ACRRI]MCG7285863.1 beta-glucoside-specific PTS transporter subunit IIABC [Cellulomonas sp. ACRRI]
MATASKYQTIADDVLRGVGGAENVASVTHCATRLRFRLHDRDRADKAAVEATPGVITVVEAGGQFQVVIGNTVNNVFEAISTRGVTTEAAASGGFLARAIDLITSIFTPFLWVLAGTGLLKALLAVVVKVSPDWAASGAYAILFSAADAIFQFLPILLAITAAKRFKANLYVSVAIACALLYSATIAVIPGPDGATLTLDGFASGGGELTFFGIPVVMISYLSAVIPTILAVYAQSHLERLLNRFFPEALRNFLTPMVTVAVIVPLTFLAIGPVSDLVGRGLSSGINWLWELSPLVGGLLMGALWQVFVIFGVHWGFVPVMLQDVVTNGYSLLTGPLFAAVLAQSGATAAVFLKTRNRDLKGVAGPATISAFLAGITEPAIYGVTLRLKKPFIYACIGGAVGGAIAAAGGSAAEGFVLPGAITLTSALNVGNFTLQLVGSALAIGIAFALTMTLGFTDIPNPPATDETPAGAGTGAGATGAAAAPTAGAALGSASGGTATATLTGTRVLEVLAPVAGAAVPLTAVPDAVFSSGALGAGAAVVPSDGRVVAPVDAEVLSVLPHAYGLRTAEGVELLVHIGIDTVQMAGAGFAPAVAAGSSVRAGDLLAEVDLAAVRAAGHDTSTVVVVTGGVEADAVRPAAEGRVSTGDALLRVSV